MFCTPVKTLILILVFPVLEPKLLNESKWDNARNQTATKDGNNILDYIQGYPQRLRLQRLLHRLSLDHFLLSGFIADQNWIIYVLTLQ